MISEEDGKLLVKIARRAIEEHLKGSEKFELDEDIPETLMEKRGVFVTLEKNGALRGV